MQKIGTDSVGNPIQVKFETFGCKVNTYDTGLLQSRVQKSGFQLQSEKPDVLVLNTCAVTQEASKEALRRIRWNKSRHPFLKVVVTGCAAQVDTDYFSELPGVDLVLGNSHKSELTERIQNLVDGVPQPKVFKSNIFKKEDLEAGGGVEQKHTRSFLKIQDGCDSFCTFCVIPFARGKSRSIPVNDLVQRVNNLAGVKEVVLTGVHIGDYEDPSGLKLEDLLQAFLDRTEGVRFRLASLEPIELSDRLFELFQHPRVCKHFHMSIQNILSSTLSRMKRKYGRSEVSETLQKIRAELPSAHVGMDFIVGFPGETEEEFEESLNLMAELPWTRIHVFPFSPRPGIYANRLAGNLDRSIIMRRAQALRRLSDERYKMEALRQLGSVKEILSLNRVNQGLSSDYWQVQTDRELEVGSLYRVKISGFDLSQDIRQGGTFSGQVI